MTIPLYSFPFKAEDFNAGERVKARHHGDGGNQAHGLDLNGSRHRSDNTWTSKTADYDGKEALKNEHFVLFAKPFYAMADGVVVGAWRNAEENTPGSQHPDRLNFLIAGGGNHLWILHDDGVYALYAHAKKGSIPARLCPFEATNFGEKADFSPAAPDIDPHVAIPKHQQVRVKKGEMLGLVGNTGASSGGPHLHVHMEKGGKPQPMTFERGLSTKIEDSKASINGPWESFSKKQVPEHSAILWPPSSLGAKLVWNGIPAADFLRFFHHFSNSGYWLDTIVCKLADGKRFYDSTWSPAKASWRGWFGLTGAEWAAKVASAKAAGMKETWHNIANGSHAGVFKQ